jgi:hypothetical protein
MLPDRKFVSVQYETHVCSKLHIVVHREGDYSRGEGRIFLLDGLIGRETNA